MNGSPPGDDWSGTGDGRSFRQRFARRFHSEMTGAGLVRTLRKIGAVDWDGNVRTCTPAVLPKRRSERSTGHLGTYDKSSLSTSGQQPKSTTYVF